MMPFRWYCAPSQNLFFWIWGPRRLHFPRVGGKGVRPAPTGAGKKPLPAEGTLIANDIIRTMENLMMLMQLPSSFVQVLQGTTKDLQLTTKCLQAVPLQTMTVRQQTSHRQLVWVGGDGVPLVVTPSPRVLHSGGSRSGPAPCSTSWRLGLPRSEARFREAFVGGGWPQIWGAARSGAPSSSSSSSSARPHSSAAEDKSKEGRVSGQSRRRRRRCGGQIRQRFRIALSLASLDDELPVGPGTHLGFGPRGERACAACCFATSMVHPEASRWPSSRCW